MKRVQDLFPLELPGSADLEEAAQVLEARALIALDPEGHEMDPDRAAVFFLAAATYRQVFEERQTREALREVFLNLTSKSIFETVFGKDTPSKRRRRWGFGAVPGSGPGSP